LVWVIGVSYQLRGCAIDLLTKPLQIAKMNRANGTTTTSQGCLRRAGIGTSICGA
jgi:hypothetical protein